MTTTKTTTTVMNDNNSNDNNNNLLVIILRSKHKRLIRSWQLFVPGGNNQFFSNKLQTGDLQVIISTQILLGSTWHAIVQIWIIALILISLCVCYKIPVSHT